MRSGIGNSASDPVFVTNGTAGGAALPAGTSTDPSFARTKSPDNIATNQVAVTTAATLVAAARSARVSITITSTSAVIFYVGPAGVTAANGLYVAAAAGASITLNTSAAVYAVGASAVTLSYLEAY